MEESENGEHELDGMFQLEEEKGVEPAAGIID